MMRLATDATKMVMPMTMMTTTMVTHEGIWMLAKWRIQMQSRSKRDPALGGELRFACQLEEVKR